MPVPRSSSIHPTRPAAGLVENHQLVDSVREKLASTGYHQLRRIDVAVEGGSVRLSGRVGRYYLLQIAQQAALETEGVSTLKNDLQVVRTSTGR
ncbi:BON domain-containing protein [bacterium]|nr:BON domain-containing protein [bacterium]